MKKPLSVSPRALSLTLTTDGDTTANGTDTCQITVSLTDGNAVQPNQTVGLRAFSSTAQFADSGTPYTTVTTGVLGEARAMLTNTVQETITVMGVLQSDSSVTGNTTATFVAGEAALLPPELEGASNGNINLTGVIGSAVAVHVPAWAGMADGDVVTLNWAGTLAGGDAGPETHPTHTVSLSETGNPVTFSIDVTQWLTPYAGGGILNLSYTTGSQTSDTAVITVDGSAGTLSPPSVDEAVDTHLAADLSSVTLRIPPWPGMAERDLLMYFWLGNPSGGGSGLTDGLHVPASMVGQDITFSLAPEVAVAPFDGSTVEAWYQVTPADGGAVQTALHGTWQVGETAALPAPIIEEAVDGQIDPGVAGGSVHTRITYPGMTDGDVLTLYWQGTKEDGTQDTEAVVSTHPVTLSEVTAGVVVLTVAAETWLTPYEGGQITVRYTGDHGGVIQASDTATFAVQQPDTLLPAPSVSEADGDILDPDTPQATVVVPVYPGMAQKDRVTLYWQGDVTGDCSDWVPVSSATVNEPLQFTVPGAQIAGNTTVSVSYVVARAAGGQAQSAILTLTTVLPQPLPAPLIDEAVDGWVILEQVVNGATARVPAGAALMAGDEVTLVVTAGGAGHRYSHPVTGGQAGQAITFPLGYVILAAADSDTLELYYIVKRINSGESETSPTTQYEVGNQGETIKDTVPVAVEATGNSGMLLKQSDYYRLDNLTIRVPVYRSMAVGDTINVYWVGRNYTYISDTKNITTIDYMDFLVPRTEFLDTIGHAAKIYFIVQKNGVGDLIQSAILWLEVEGQTRELPAPDVSDDLMTVTVIYAGMSANDMAKIRVTGRNINESELKKGNNNNRLTFKVDSSWLERNDRGQLFYDYAVGENGGEYQFSRITRIG